MKRLLLIAGILLLCIVPASAYYFTPHYSDYTDHTGYYYNHETYVPGQQITMPNLTEINEWRARFGGSGPGSSGCGAFADSYGWNNTAEIYPAEYGTAYTTSTAADIHYYSFYVYTSGNSRFMKIWYEAGYEPTLISNFNASITSGAGPLYVDLIDNSTTNSTPLSLTYNWTITPPTGWYLTAGTINSRNISANFVTNGNYSISHGVSASYGSSIETKTDYIWVYNSSATVTTPFTAMDIAFGHPIQGAAINLYDIENSSWTNTSSTGPDGKAHIVTLQGHTINAYASAAGYGDQDLIGVDANSYPGHILYMFPANYTNVTAGNVAVFIGVIDGTNSVSPIPGATVTGLLSGVKTVKVSDSAGIAQFVYPNNSIVSFDGIAPGWQGSTTTLNTGTGSGGSAAVTGKLYLWRSTVTTAPTVTTLPGGGTPTPTVTYLKYCDPSATDYDEEKCRSSENTGMMDQLRDAGPSLIGLCILAMVFGLLKMIMG